MQCSPVQCWSQRWLDKSSDQIRAMRTEEVLVDGQIWAEVTTSTLHPPPPLCNVWSVDTSLPPQHTLIRSLLIQGLLQGGVVWRTILMLPHTRWRQMEDRGHCYYCYYGGYNYCPDVRGLSSVNHLILTFLHFYALELMSPTEDDLADIVLFKTLLIFIL